MMRQPEMETFVAASVAALRASGAGGLVAERLAAAGRAGQGAPKRLPVCDWLAPAVRLAESGPRSALAAAFAAVEPGLAWVPRKGAEGAFRDAHANTVILGPGGLEERDDLWVGVTVMAPGTIYPTHAHAPEEVYLSLTPGEWWNSQMDWTDPGPEGFIYNPPGIDHAMRAGATPFLALWYLPL
jgi:quercetin dioxygenase-like cupin family protein